MTARWLNPAVFLFWLATMSWLVTAKVLPPLIVGEPPTYRTIVRDAQGQHQPDAATWKLTWEGRIVGWATTRVVVDPDELTEIISQVHFDDLPVEEMTPLRMGAFVKSMRGNERLTLDAESRVSIDPLGHLEQFRSSVDFAGIPQAIVVRGNVENSELKLTVRSGDFSYPTKCYLPPDALVNDVLSPHSRLPNLRVGQSWTVPVYSPFHMPNTPMQVLKASVARQEQLHWDGANERVLVVEYRGDEGSGLRMARDPLGTVWVSRQGQVLMQEVRLLGGKLRFTRVSPREIAALAIPEVAQPTPGP